MSVNILLLTIYIVTTRCMYEGICDGIKLSIGSTFDPVVFKWLWSDSLYDSIFF